MAPPHVSSVNRVYRAVWYVRVLKDAKLPQQPEQRQAWKWVLYPSIVPITPTHHQICWKTGGLRVSASSLV